MGLNLIVLARCFAIDPNDIKEGVTYRYVGFYGSLIKALFRRSPESSVFWYSVCDQSVRVMHQNRCEKKKTSMISAIVRAVSETYRNGSYLGVIIAYPSVLPKIDGMLEYFFCLFVLRLFSLGRTKVVVDDFDSGVGAIYDFSETKPSTIITTYFQVLEKVTLKLSSLVVVIGEFWRNYVAHTYHVPLDKVIVVSNGSLVRLVPYSLKKQDATFTTLYAGSTMKVKDVDKLIEAIKELRSQDVPAVLNVAGKKVTTLPSWVNLAHYDWPGFVCKVLPQSDVCVIPYSPNKFTFLHSIPAKLFDYMAAAKPVVSTNLEEVGEILRSNNCGLIAKDWVEFVAHLKILYEDRKLSQRLGNNGRIAVEKYFNYEVLAETFLENLLLSFHNEAKTSSHIKVT